MRRIVGVVLAAAFLCAVSLKLLPLPFAWIGLTGMLACVAIAMAAPRWAQGPLLLAATLAFALLAGEVAIRFGTPPEVVHEVPPALYARDSVLGWKPNASQSVNARALVGDRVIYDARYTIDSAGHRISPPVEPGQECILFFADSFVFGEGVEDEEAFPYRVGQALRGSYGVINFGAPGYGAEHMLAALDHDLLHPPCRPRYVFYLALPHHVLRSAGTAGLPNSPHYVLDADGTPEYVGRYVPPAKQTGSIAALAAEAEWQLQKSRLYRFWKARPAPTTEADVTLYFAILRRAVALFRARWPDAEVHLIGWDLDGFYALGRERFDAELKAIGPPVHFIDDILPGYTSDPLPYSIDPADLHPNARADSLVAAYIADRVVRPSAPRGP